MPAKTEVVENSAAEVVARREVVAAAQVKGAEKDRVTWAEATMGVGVEAEVVAAAVAVEGLEAVLAGLAEVEMVK